MRRGAAVGALALAALLALQPAVGQSRQSPRLPQSVRLYVLDGGTLESDPARYRLTKEEISAAQLSVTAFLIAHPRGTLMWDTGAIADDTWTPNGKPVRRRLVLSNGQERIVTLRTTMKAQLAAIGYAPSDITYLALSHYHWDHTANANQFVRSTWLARQVERDVMLPEKVPDPPQPSTFAELKNGKTVLISGDDHDVFRDGTVVIKLSKGHTPGHQVLYVRLAKTGGIVLSGDLYHYPEERTLNRLPTFEFDMDQTRQSREALEAFLEKTGARLWIQHDFTAMAKVRKAPAFYD
ncbi:MAG: N-acyl homoserine lactonase family protein [Vicinamibacterales bacterium]